MTLYNFVAGSAALHAENAGRIAQAHDADAEHDEDMKHEAPQSLKL